FVYPDITSHILDTDYFVDRAILAPTNSNVDIINDTILNSFSNKNAITYFSADSIIDQKENDQAHLYPIEFLNTIKINGLSPHKLQLKIGTPIMLLRNLNPAEGLCNGTRLICYKFYRHTIEAKIITGKYKGTRVLIPRITLTPTTTNLPFTIQRRQFPVSLAFAMTINKSQGQSLSR
ncbi:10274_t:CDS:1, partial [Gigaspora margarita]